MRVVDLQQDKAPPEVKLSVERMFPPEPEPEEVATGADALVEEPVAKTIPLKKRKGSASVSVKLSEESVIKGKTVAAGEVVQVSRKEADGLVEAGKGAIAD